MKFVFENLKIFYWKNKTAKMSMGKKCPFFENEAIFEGKLNNISLDHFKGRLNHIINPGGYLMIFFYPFNIINVIFDNFILRIYRNIYFI